MLKSNSFKSSKSVTGSIPHLKEHQNAVQLVVDEEAFLILRGEPENSSSSSLDYLKPIWPKLVQMNLNTVLAPVYGDLIEPEEGKYEEERWVGGRRMCGDQSHQSRHLHLPSGSFGIQRIKLYRYR